MTSKLILMCKIGFKISSVNEHADNLLLKLKDF